MIRPRFPVLTSLLAAVLPFLAGGASAETQTPLAIKGYDAVAYFTLSKPTLGSTKYQTEWDGSNYRFISAKHRGMFQRDPDRYTPRYRGLCAMGLAAKGYKVVADPNNWVIHEGRLYITQRAYGPAAFRKHPNRWVANANAHLAALKDAPVGSGLSWW